MSEIKVQLENDSFSNDENVVAYSLGTLDWSIYECISDKHVTDEVIITEEQLYHIRDKRPNTGLVIKRISCGDDNMLLVLRISTSEDKEGYKNSLITSWKITEKRLNNYLRNKEVIYKKE